jgi:hypothetical protein
MPPSPLAYRPGPRDIVSFLASVDHKLSTFFYDNPRLSTMSGITGTDKSSSPAVDPPLSRKQLKSSPIRPGVVLDITSDYATVAMFTTLQGKAPSEIKGLLRHLIATIHPVHNKRHPDASSGLPMLAIYPISGRVARVATRSLCLCLKHRIPLDELKPWSWKDEPEVADERFRMCKGDFKALQQLCERNEHLRGLFASEISWLFQELYLDDFVKWCS